MSLINGDQGKLTYESSWILRWSFPCSIAIIIFESFAIIHNLNHKENPFWQRIIVMDFFLLCIGLLTFYFYLTTRIKIYLEKDGLRFFINRFGKIKENFYLYNDISSIDIDFLVNIKLSLKNNEVIILPGTITRVSDTIFTPPPEAKIEQKNSVHTLGAYLFKYELLDQIKKKGD